MFDSLKLNFNFILGFNTDEAMSKWTCLVLAVLLEIAVHGVGEIEHLGAGNRGVGGAKEST